MPLLEEIRKNIENTIDDSNALSVDAIEAHVNIENAIHALEELASNTEDPFAFIDKYWHFAKRLSYAYDLDDYYEDDDLLWKGDFHRAARHIVDWDLINDNDHFGFDEFDEKVQERIKNEFLDWTDNLQSIPLRWRLPVCMVVDGLFNEIGGMSKDGNFVMTTPVEMVIDSLDEPHRTMLQTTGDYSVVELQGIIESIPVTRLSAQLPQVDYVENGASITPV